MFYTYAVPILFVVLMWWLSTGVVLWLAIAPSGKPRFRLLGMTGLCALGFAGVYASSQGMGTVTPYLAFMSALAVWALIEFTFLTGLLTGPRSTPCPQDISESKRFRLAFLTISHHEYALLAALIAVGLISVAGEQIMAFATFLLLWLMRVSAKLTLFSGAPKFSLELMPSRIAHMQSYFRHDRIGPVFWVSTLVSTLVLAVAIFVLAKGGFAPENVIPAIMLTTLLGLGVLEHWFMVLPVADGTLWRWAVPGAGNGKPLQTQSTNPDIDRHDRVNTSDRRRPVKIEREQHYEL